eukprot:768476-Hanusia_phi.AAC.7
MKRGYSDKVLPSVGWGTKTKCLLTWRLSGVSRLLSCGEPKGYDLVALVDLPYGDSEVYLFPRSEVVGGQGSLGNLS